MVNEDNSSLNHRSTTCCGDAGTDTDGQQSSQPDNAGQSNEGVRLAKNIGLWEGVSVIVGVIVGSGIFISPAGVYKNAGSICVALIVWGLCGLLSLMGALCMAELGTSIADSGGDYSYIKMAYGSCLSFLYLWVTVLIILPCSNALAALTFANYVLQPFYDNCDPPTMAIRLIALAIILILVWVNCYSVKLSIKLQNSFTLTKVIALVLVIVFGFYYIVAGKSEITRDRIWDEKAITFYGLGTAFYSGLYSYAGWNALNFVTEEIKNPIKNMPRAIIISISSITLIYILVNVAYFAVLNNTEFLSNSAVAVTFGKKALGLASFLVPLSVALSTTSGLNGLIFSSSRILFVGARQGQLFSLLNMISIENLTPVPSLLFVGLMSALYLITTHINSLINYVVFIEASFGALAVSTVLILRYKFPETRRPLKVHTYIPVVYLIVSTFLILAPIFNEPTEALIGTVILLTGVPAYYLTANWKVKPRLYQKTIDRLNSLTQKLTLSVTPEDQDK